jgi:light-regulated signal transduction histidine kinase (bacteriophytochrome)
MKLALIQSDAEEPSMVAIARDITDIKEAETRLLKYTHDLENSNRELDDFAYIASHDLKEPLRGMQSFSQFLLEDYEGRLEEDGVKKLRRISDLATRLDQLLNVLLHYSRLGRTALAMEKTDMETLIRKSVAMFSISLEQKKAAVDIKAPLPAIECDHVRIGEVFQNLIGNANKYCDGDGNKNEIGCRTDHPRAPGQNVFFVRDHGIGIPTELQDKVFKIFKRLHPKEAYGGGTGSGLAICKKIIGQHNGQIWIESEGEGRGTTFCFTIPQRGRRAANAA